jgi:fluoride ion exporter CrcB/FEX
MDNISILWIALAAFFGGFLSGLIGLADAIKIGEKFIWSKLLTTIITAFIAGIGFALVYQFSGDRIGWVDILQAIFAGAGGDALVNRIGKLK